MGLLKIPGADLRRWNMRGDTEHWHTRAVAVEEAIDEMKIPGSAATGADGKLPREMRLGTCRKGSHFLVPDMDPFDLPLATKRVGEPVETVADNAVDPLDTCCDEYVRKLIRDGLCQGSILSIAKLLQLRAAKLPKRGLDTIRCIIRRYATRHVRLKRFCKRST
jgi:hypothetical protein